VGTKHVLLLGLSLLIIVPVVVAGNEQVKHQPRWQFDLRHFGLRTPGRWHGLNDFGSDAKLAITTGRVIVAFETYNNEAVPGSGEPFVVDVSIFDTVTGRNIAHQRWPSPSPAFAVSINTIGNIVLMIGGETLSPTRRWPAVVLLLSPDDLHTVRRVVLPSTQTTYWQGLFSASGKSLLLSGSLPNKQYDHLLLDPDTLALRKEWFDDVYPKGISDSFALAQTFSEVEHRRKFLLSRFDEHWTDVGIDVAGDAIPISDSAIMVTSTSVSTFSVPVGQRLFSHVVTAENTEVRLESLLSRSSADGRRLAVVAYTKPKHWYIPVRNFVLVYEPPDTEPIFTLELPRIEAFKPVLAFSSNADALVLIHSGRVQYFELPGPSPQSH
jgi:hypothetical protein